MGEEVIQFAGLDQLNDSEKEVVNRLCSEYHEKVRRSLNNLTSLVVHFKCYEKEGKRKKFSLHLRCIAPGRVYESDKKAHGWVLEQVLHGAFDALLRQISRSLDKGTSAIHKSPSFKKSQE